MLYPGAAWSQDGNWIVIAPSGKNGLLFVRPDGSEKRPLRVPASIDFARHPRFSPDGTRLVFDMTLTGQSKPDIYTMKMDGTELEQITNTPAEYEFDPDWGVDAR